MQTIRTALAVMSVALLCGVASVPAYADGPSITDAVQASSIETMRKELREAEERALEALRLARVALVFDPGNNKLKKRIAAVEKRIKWLLGRAKALEENDTLQDERLDGIDERLDGIDESLTALDERDEDLQKQDDQLRKDLEELEAELTALKTELDKSMLCSVVGLGSGALIHRSIPGVTGPISGHLGMHGGVCLENEYDGMTLSAGADLATPSGYTLYLDLDRYRKTDQFAYGYVLGGSATFYQAFPGPDYRAYEGGFGGGFYGRYSLFENEKYAWDLVLKAKIVVGRVGTYIPVVHKDRVVDYTPASAGVATFQVSISLQHRRKYGAVIADTTSTDTEELDEVIDEVESPESESGEEA